MSWGSGSWGAGPWGSSLLGQTLQLPRLNIGDVRPPSIQRDVALRFMPQQGPFTGGTEVTLAGSALDMRSCTPRFNAIDPGFWNTTGSVAPTSSGYALVAGPAAGSIARLRTVDQAGDIDIEVSARLQELVLPFILPVTVMELALRANANTALRLRVSLNQTQLVVTQNGQTFTDLTVGESARSPSIRLLRYGHFVVVFLGGTIATVVEWTDELVNVELTARNGTSVDSEVRTLVTRYLRRPVLLFDGSPMVQLRQPSPTTAVGSVPPAIDSTPGPVPVQVTGCSPGRDTAQDSFLYLLTDQARIGIEPGTRQLLSLAVTGRVGRSV